MLKIKYYLFQKICTLIAVIGKQWTELEKQLFLWIRKSCIQISHEFAYETLYFLLQNLCRLHVFIIKSIAKHFWIEWIDRNYLFNFSYPELKMQHVLHGHPANCICIEFDPMGKYFATGSADALCSLWDVGELVCVRTFAR